MQPINHYNYNSKFESVEKQKKMSWKQMIVKFFALIIVLSWFWVIYYGALHGLAFLSDTHWKMDSPKGSPSDTAIHAAYNLFPHKVTENQFTSLIIISSETENVIQDENVRNFTYQLQDAAVDCGDNQKEKMIDACFIRGSESYFNLRNDLERKLMKYKFVAKNEKATLIYFFTNDHNMGNTYQYAMFDNLQNNYIDKFVAKHPNYKVEQTYEQLILRDGQTQVIGDFEHADIMTLPIACLVLFAVVGTPAILTLFTLSASALTGFLIMIPMADAPKDKRVNFPSFSPSIFVCMLLAMALDYALFLFVRYREALDEELWKKTNENVVDNLNDIETNNSNSNNDNNITTDMNMIAVYKVLSTSGKVVFLSAFILAASFFGLSFVNVPMVSSIGIGGAVVVLSTMVVNLTLVPSILLLVGQYLYCRNCCCNKKSKGNNNSRTEEIDNMKAFDYEALDTTAASKRNTKNNKCTCHYICTNHTKVLQGFYYRIGKFVEKRKFVVAFIIFGITAAFIPILLRINISTDQLLITPRNAPSLKAFLTMEKYELAKGLISPINVIVVPPTKQKDQTLLTYPCADDDVDFKIEADNHYIGDYIKSCSDALTLMPDFCKTKKKLEHVDVHKIAVHFCQKTCPEYCPSDRYRILEEEVFDKIALFKKELRKMYKESSPNNYKKGIAFFEDITSLSNGTTIHPSTAISILNKENSKLAETVLGNPTIDSLYVEKFKNLASYDRNAVYLKVYPNEYSFNEDAIQLMLNIRKLSNYTEFKDYKFYVASQPAQVYDLTTQVYQQCPPIVVGIIVVVVFVLSGLAFRSLILSFRLLITISVTIIWVGTFTILIFDAIGFGIYWLVPVCCVPIVTGLTLDYDTFLISRIYEFRIEGYSSRNAILKGLKVSGSSITYAGLIMATAFSALIFTPEYVLNEFGAVLVLSSLLDTVVVHGFLVPSLMFIGGDEWLWWPNKMPEVTKEDDN